MINGARIRATSEEVEQRHSSSPVQPVGLGGSPWCSGRCALTRMSCTDPLSGHPLHRHQHQHQHTPPVQSVASHRLAGRLCCRSALQLPRAHPPSHTIETTGHTETQFMSCRPRQTQWSQSADRLSRVMGTHSSQLELSTSSSRSCGGDTRCSSLTTGCGGGRRTCPVTSTRLGA